MSGVFEFPGRSSQIRTRCISSLQTLCDCRRGGYNPARLARFTGGKFINRLPNLPRPVWIIALCGIVLTLLILFDIFPFLRGDFGWRWPYQLASVARIIPLILGVILYIAGAYALLQASARPLFVVLWSMAGVVVLSVLIVNVRAENVMAELFARTASTLTTGVHYAGMQLAPDSPAWSDWITTIQQNPNFGAHVLNGPPGLPLFYSLLSAGFEGAPGIASPLFRALLVYQCQNYDLLSYTPGQWASAWFGALMPAWASLGVLPLYAIAKRLPSTNESARGVALWYPLIPALGLFAPTWYTFYPMWMLITFWLLVTGIENRSPLRLILAGVVMGLSTFMAYAFVPVLGFFGAYTLAHYWWKERPAGLHWSRPIITGIWFGVGLALPWLIYWIASGDTPFSLLAASLNLHLELERPYLPWVFLHFWDWMLFNGVVFFLAWLVGLGLWRRKEHVPLVGLALLVAMVVLCISGTARGETGRVWLVFTPFALLAAGEAFSRLYIGTQASTEIDHVANQDRWLVLALAQGAVLIALAASLNVMRTDFTPPPSPPQIADGLQPVNAAFSVSDDGAFRLTGWNAVSEGDAIQLTLAWEGVQQNTRPYYFGAVLVAPDGATVNAGVWQPGQGATVAADSPDAPRGTYPTTCWLPGTAIGDTVTLPLPPDAEAGDWWISLSAFGDPATTDGRLAVTLADGSADMQVGLGPVAVQ
jgi:hypothetical protein